jgi:hypothetical protein
MRLAASAALLALLMLGAWAYRPALSLGYVNSNAGIANVQVSFPVYAGATDFNGQCVSNAAYDNDRSESWLAVDPTNPRHLVGMSKFFYKPVYYLFHVGAYVSFDAGKTWSNQVVPGFDCQSAPDNAWVDTTDPVLAFDSRGRLFSAFLPFSFSYNAANQQVWNVIPNSAIFVVKSVDGGRTWTIANKGKPLAIYTSSGLGRTADKQWIAADASPKSPFRDYVYVGWSVFNGFSSEVWFSRSTDHGESFSQPVMLSKANTDQPFNTYIFLGTAPDGTLYVVYTAFPSSTFPVADIWLLKSYDGGQTFSGPYHVISFPSFPFLTLPNTTFRDGISDSFAVSPSNGHLFIAMEVYHGKGIDVQLIESTDGGLTWSQPIYVNDAETVDDGTDQFQPTVAIAPNGIVAVAFYDRRLPCPSNDPNILKEDWGKRNFCIDVSIQFFADGAQGLRRLGDNIRVTSASWDPQVPGSKGLPHPGGPNSSVTFIGDYFGLALTSKFAYVLFVSTRDLGQNPYHDQQQFLAVVKLPG